MLIQLITQHPEALGSIFKRTPTWVWGLFATLLALGLSQVRSRKVRLPRMILIPLVMTSLSFWSTVSAFGSSTLFSQVVLCWITGATLMLSLVASRPPQTGTRYDVATHHLHLPGSWVPLALIMGIFLTKFVVGIDLAMQPALARDFTYALTVSGLHGIFSGVFAGRALRQWRLVQRSNTTATPIVNA
jgi:hypothetical protein